MATITDDFNDSSKISSSTNLQVASGVLEPDNNNNSGYLWDEATTSRYITIPSVFDNTTEQNFTFSFWIKTELALSGTRFMFDSIGSPANYFSLYFYNLANIRVETNLISGGALTVNSTTPNILDYNSLIQIGIVRSGTDNLLRIFINGLLCASSTDSRAGTFYNTFSQQVGARYSLGGTNHWSGNIFDFKVWRTTALTDLEMHANYLNLYTPTPNRHYKLYADANDSGSDAQNGTVQGSMPLASTIQTYKKFNQVISTDLLEGAGTADTFKYTLERLNA